MIEDWIQRGPLISGIENWGRARGGRAAAWPGASGRVSAPGAPEARLFLPVRTCPKHPLHRTAASSISRAPRCPVWDVPVGSQRADGARRQAER